MLDLRVMSTYSHGEVRTRIELKYGLVLRVSGGLRDDGCKFDRDREISSEEDRAAMPPEWSVNTIRSLHHAVGNIEFHQILSE